MLHNSTCIMCGLHMSSWVGLRAIHMVHMVFHCVVVVLRVLRDLVEAAGIWNCILPHWDIMLNVNGFKSLVDGMSKIVSKSHAYGFFFTCVDTICSGLFEIRKLSVQKISSGFNHTSDALSRTYFTITCRLVKRSMRAINK